MGKQKHYILLALLSLALSAVQAQNTFRRHFVIAYDVSTPFILSEESCPAYKEALINLFNNQPVYGFNEANQDNLNVEKKNGLKLFDKEKDEISFFHFNISEIEFNRLRWNANNYDEKGIVEEFNKLFLKDKKFNWSSFFSSTSGRKTINDYFDSTFSIQPNPVHFERGVSMSNFVYPLVLDRIDGSKYAEEYILIILSDFLTGSMLGNTKDLDRVRDIYKIPYGVTIPSNSPVSYIKKKIDYMAAQYYKIDFFQYSYVAPFRNNLIGILGYKVKPKVGVLSPEDIALFVDGDLSLNQSGYQSTDFKTNETKIKFTHNTQLVPEELNLTISMPSGNSEATLFQDLVASKDDEGVWKSKHTEDDQLMLFDSTELTYDIPSLKITLDSIINNRNFENLKFKYEFKTKYELANAQPLNFIYATERVLPIENINYSTKATIIIMYYFLPILAISLLVIFLLVYGKPRRLFFSLDGYLDSFEKIDYKTEGKLITPFKAWNYKTNGGTDFLLVKGSLEFKSSSFLFNWNSPVFLQLSVEKIPSGFELFIKHDMDDLKEFGVGTPTAIRSTKNGNLSFVIGIRQTDITKQVIDPELIKFSAEAVVKDSIGLIKAELRDTIDYKFHIGEDLGDVWVGFDPGTSGSCVAVGSLADNIILGEDFRISEEEPERRIIPSVLVFDKTENYQKNGMEIPEKIYNYGNFAKARFQNEKQYRGFQSIKKLLGYNTEMIIEFDNRNTLSLKGKTLAGLLVKGLFKDINTYFNGSRFNADEYKRGNPRVFDPLRAVVAIPNNFTTLKIQDMIDCIANLNHFKEIRYIYEAEAVLFYYLSNFSQLSPGEKSLDSGTILVFDMGGATINATIVTVNKTMVSNKPKYEIDLLGKIGYGIGGDTIDYCLIKFILSCTKEFPQLAGIDLFNKKIKLAELAFRIKREMIVNYYANKEYLIPPDNLQTYINSALGVSIIIDEHSSAMFSYFVKSAGKFKLFDHPLFTKTIYNNVKDAVKEVVALSDNTHIDKIIFSGRSNSFPLIKETVEKQLKSKDSQTKSIALDLEESKIAVAKGACWYGINKNYIILNNLKTNASFGFKKTLSADQRDVKFFELVPMGCNFDTENDGIDSFQGIHEIEDSFDSDSNKVNFYQVMGKDAVKILSEGQKHKFSKIATIIVDKPTSKVAMRVNENDQVDCAVILNTNRKLEGQGTVADQEIDEANEEHYTWIVK